MENVKNKERYDFFVDDFLRQVKLGEAKEGFENVYALTEIIAEAIKDKTYKVYYGGGYYPDETEILKYDIVCWFNLSNDPFFMMCVDISEGDECNLIRYTKDGFNYVRA